MDVERRPAFRSAESSSARGIVRGPSFDRRDTLVLKGLGILAIALHNYFHLLSPAKQNEFHFHQERGAIFLSAVGDPRDALPALFSFLGHYGVQIFIFLSAYGLAKSHWDEQVGWRPFLWSRIRKLYPMFIVAVLLWLLVSTVTQGLAGLTALLHENGVPLVLTCMGVLNFVPGYGLPPVGPWWFLPFILQFYAIWPLLRRYTVHFGLLGLAGLTASSLALLATANLVLISHNSVNLLFSPIGHLPEICLGIAAARYGVFPRAPHAALAAACLVFGNAYRIAWPLSYLSALVLMLWLYKCTRHYLRRRSMLTQVGSVSMALFFTNGFVRTPFVDRAAMEGTWVAEWIFAAAAVTCAYLLASILTRRLAPLNAHQVMAADLNPG